jgi:hypothetical protein
MKPWRMVVSKTARKKIGAPDRTENVCELSLWEPVLSVEIISIDLDIALQPDIPCGPKGKEYESTQAKKERDG